MITLVYSENSDARDKYPSTIWAWRVNRKLWSRGQTTRSNVFRVAPGLFPEIVQVPGSAPRVQIGRPNVVNRQFIPDDGHFYRVSYLR